MDDTISIKVIDDTNDKRSKNKFVISRMFFAVNGKQYELRYTSQSTPPCEVEACIKEVRRKSVLMLVEGLQNAIMDEHKQVINVEIREIRGYINEQGQVVRVYANVTTVKDGIERSVYNMDYAATPLLTDAILG